MVLPRRELACDLHIRKWIELQAKGQVIAPEQVNRDIARTTADSRSLFLFTHKGLTATWLLIEQLPVKRPSNLNYSYTYPISCGVESKEP
jgi:hypothetical protein